MADDASGGPVLDRGEREALLEAHLDLVQQMARRYASLGVDRADLEQEGALGLMTAAERFDPARGVAFATYARWWVRHRMQRYLTDNRAVVPLPKTRALRTTRRRLRGATRAIEARTGTRATDAMLAAELGVSEEDVALARAELGARQVELDPERDAGSPVDEPNTPEARVARRELQQNAEKLVASALGGLDERERWIVAERRLSDEPRSLRDLGRSLRISAERVRQLEKRAFSKMMGALSDLGVLEGARVCARQLAL